MKTSTIIFIIVGILLLIGGIGLVVYLSTKKTSSQNSNQSSNPFSYLFAQPLAEQGGLLKPGLQVAGQLVGKAIDAGGQVGSSAVKNPLLFF